ncbi:MAG: hypothetical protein EOM45_05875, partial [Clostridia bacterium]|nr:hypothetical protein [Clostridia bacterium]
MKKNVTFTVDADIYEKFCIALNLTDETQDDAAENCMRWYIKNYTMKALYEGVPGYYDRTPTLYEDDSDGDDD